MLVYICGTMIMDTFYNLASFIPFLQLPLNTVLALPFPTWILCMIDFKPFPLEFLSSIRILFSAV